MSSRPSRAPGLAKAGDDARTARAGGDAGPAETGHYVRLRVRYAETDQMGVVYYSNYLVWFEIGRTEWLRDRGWTYREIEQDGVGLPVIEAHCQYRQPARYDDELEIRTSARLLTPTRIRFDYEVLRSDASVAVGHTIHAAVSRSGRPCRLPDRVVEFFL